MEGRKSAKRMPREDRREPDAIDPAAGPAEIAPEPAASDPSPDLAPDLSGDTDAGAAKPARKKKAAKTAPKPAARTARDAKPPKPAAKPEPPRKRGVKARPLRRQIAALPFRVRPDGRREVLILTSRETKRFVIPKGWPMKKKKKAEVAAIEAFEEAGVRGTVGRKPVGRYTYWKRLKDSFALIRVVVYSLEVREDLGDWPERDQRQVSWLAPADAAILVDEPGLSRIIREFG
jgi:8-oxo-dGTP pyrophosphatase MutT (NUDIX family)